MALQTKVV